MITWTEAANAAFDEHMSAIAPELLALGLVPAQVEIRLRISINEELARAGLSVAGREEVVAAIEKIGPDFKEQLKRPAQSSSVVLGWWARIASMIFGVVIPLTALGVEAVEGICAEMFDPIPTLWHMVAIAFVAFSNGWVTVLLSRQNSERSQWWAHAISCNAVAVGIAAYYAIWFLPITHYAVLGIVVFGLGLLPLSPLLAMITGLLLRRKFRKRTSAVPVNWPKLWMGALAGFAGLLAMEMPGVFTHWAATKVAQGTAVEQQQVLSWLRKFGSEEQLLRSCRWGRQRDEFRDTVLGVLFGKCEQSAAQVVYYRVTGQSHTQAKITDRIFRPRGMRQRDWAWDEDLGGGVVGQKFPELRLKESRLDGSLNGDSATGYVEWTLVFRNDNEFQQREARALMQLPPGAVVSRLTLWINGEEHEAAFGGRNQVRQAYQAVVQKRRDPVLVSSRGADRVLVQCFPVEPKGGEMKVRIGISLPLVLDSWNEAKTGLPHIVEQNFTELNGLKHAVWIEAKQPITATVADVRQERAASGRAAAAFTLTTEQLTAGGLNLTVTRDASIRQVIAMGRENNTPVVRQDFQMTAPGELLRIVLDGSRGMESAGVALAAALRKLPERTPVILYRAGDTVTECPYHAAMTVAAWVERQECVGGQDATDALLRASVASSAGRNDVLWIYGQQPILWQPVVELEQKIARSGTTTRFLTLAGMAGTNALVEEMSASGALEGQPRLGRLENDMERILRRVREGGIELRRTQVPAENYSSDAPPASDHVVRLGALDEVKRLSRGNSVQKAEAVRLAVAMQLVTPVSSAVVLETKAQYDAAGLEPVNPDTVPSVPDAAQTVVFLGIALVGFFAFSRHFKCRAIRQ